MVSTCRINPDGTHHVWTGSVNRAGTPSCTITRPGGKRPMVLARLLMSDYWGIPLHDLETETGREQRVSTICPPVKCVSPQHTVVLNPDKVLKRVEKTAAKRKALRKRVYAAGTTGHLDGAWWNTDLIETQDFCIPHATLVLISHELSVSRLATLAVWSELVTNDLKEKDRWNGSRGMDPPSG